MTAVCITHPVDQTKIRTQTQRVRLPMSTTVANTLRSSGVSGLWVGLTGSLLRQATYGSARFGIYNYLKERDTHNKVKGGRLRLIQNGAIAGLVAGIAGSPAGE